ARAGAVGSALGESVAFFIGRSGRTIAEETRFYGWVKQQLRHPWRAFVVLFGLAAPINPAFDVAGLAAGALGVPYWLFFTAVFMGRLIRFWLIALAGAQWCTSGGTQELLCCAQNKKGAGGSAGRRRGPAPAPTPTNGRALRRQKEDLSGPSAPSAGTQQRA